MNWLRNFMYGRYGNDGLNIALLIFSFLISGVFRCFPWPIRLGIFAGYAVLFIVFFRMLSRNIERRRRENDVFMRGFRKLTGWFRGHRAKSSDKMHRYFKCPDCGAQLRVPRNRGKIEITCPRCKKQFIKKT